MHWTMILYWIPTQNGLEKTQVYKREGSNSRMTSEHRPWRCGQHHPLTVVRLDRELSPENKRRPITHTKVGKHTQTNTRNLPRVEPFDFPQGLVVGHDGLHMPPPMPSLVGARGIFLVFRARARREREPTTCRRVTNRPALQISVHLSGSPGRRRWHTSVRCLPTQYL